MKFEPMKPAPPVTRMRSSMPGMRHCAKPPRSDSNRYHSRTRSAASAVGVQIRRGVDPGALSGCRSVDRDLTRHPAQHVVIGFFDGAGDFGPEILALDPLALPGCGLTAKFGIADEQVEHVLKIGLVAATEGEAGALDH